MNDKVEHALQRLGAVLPLQAGLRSLDIAEAGLYCRLLRSYVERGRALTRDEAAGLVADAARSLDRLAASKLVVLDTEGSPVGAYPFTSAAREHRVRIGAVTAHCMCALDALAVSPTFDRATVVDSVCRATGAEIHLEQRDTGFTGGTLDACFGIDWDAAADGTACAESLCLEMIFLANPTIANDWLSVAAATREIFDLRSATVFAAAFFAPIARVCRATA